MSLITTYNNNTHNRRINNINNQILFDKDNKKLNKSNLKIKIMQPIELHKEDEGFINFKVIIIFKLNEKKSFVLYLYFLNDYYCYYYLCW